MQICNYTLYAVAPPNAEKELVHCTRKSVLLSKYHDIAVNYLTLVLIWSSALLFVDEPSDVHASLKLIIKIKDWRK